MSHSMMHMSMPEREEDRIFEELISRFDSLTEAQMSVVGVTSEWSAKDLLAHLAYWERAAADQIREFEAGRWSAKKRTRAQMEHINREVVSANRATPRHLLREELMLARSEIVAAMKRARGTGGNVSARSHYLLSLRAAQGPSPGTTSRLGCTSWQIIVNEKESSGSTQLDSADAGPFSGHKKDRPSRRAVQLHTTAQSQAHRGRIFIF